MRRSALFLAAWLLCGTAAAEVAEDFAYSDYEVPVLKGRTLREELNAASPVRVNGAIYHAYTQWDVHWHYRYQTLPSGRCSIASVQTSLTATMTLPAPSAPAIAQDPQFVHYLEALRRHEQGHYLIGQRTAAAIDAGIFTLPSAEACADLGAAADALARDELEKARATEHRYDRDTGAGRTQGAFLN